MHDCMNAYNNIISTIHKDSFCKTITISIAGNIHEVQTFRIFRGLSSYCEIIMATQPPTKIILRAFEPNSENVHPRNCPANGYNYDCPLRTLN